MEEELIVKDSNGNRLKDGDSVIFIKSLLVKGKSITLKKGMEIKSIKFTEHPKAIACKVDRMCVVFENSVLEKSINLRSLYGLVSKM